MLFSRVRLQKLRLLQAAVQELAPGQNCSDLFHKREGKVGEKEEEVEGNPFYRLHMAEMHSGGQKSKLEGGRWFCS